MHGPSAREDVPADPRTPTPDHDRGAGDRSGTTAPPSPGAPPAGTTILQRGARVGFGVADGERGEQALSVRVLEPLPSVAAAARTSPEAMVPVVGDLIRLLDGLSQGYRRGRHPEGRAAHRTAELPRAVADDLDT